MYTFHISKIRLAWGWKNEWTILIIIFVVLRSIAAGCGMLFAWMPLPDYFVSIPVYNDAITLLHDNSLSNLFVNVWFRWDTAWYLRIAAFGYEHSGTIAFSPLYPLLVAILGTLSGDYLFSALLLSGVATIFVYILFYEVALVEGIRSETAMRVVFSLIVFPSAFFFFAAYTESLFLALTLGTWLAIRHERWFLAGFLGMLATLTRLQGALLAMVLLWSWLITQNPGFKLLQPGTWFEASKSLRQLSWIYTLLPAITFAGWTAYLRISEFGSVPETLETVWSIETVPPWQGIGLFIERLITTKRGFTDYIDISALVFIIVLLIIGLRRIDPRLSVYAWMSLFLFFMRGSPPFLLESFSRYMLVVFPAFLVLAKVRSWMFHVILWSIFSGMLVLLMIGFLAWRWVA